MNKLYFFILVLFINVSFPQVEPDNIDVRLFRTINNNRTKFKDDFFNVTDRSVLSMSIILPFSLFTYSRIYEKTYDENTAYLLGISEATNLVLTFGLKYLFKRPRPYSTLRNVHTKNSPKFDKSGALPGKWSFPSGHTSSSFTISTIFAIRYPKYPQVYLPMYLWSFLVAYGRPYFGMHYPTDLLGGAVAGTLSSVFIYSLRSGLFKFKNNLFNEKNKPDEGSIKDGTLTIFTSTFILSSLLNEFVFPKSKNLRIKASPIFLE